VPALLRLRPHKYPKTTTTLVLWLLGLYFVFLAKPPYHPTAKQVRLRGCVGREIPCKPPCVLREAAVQLPSALTPVALLQIEVFEAKIKEVSLAKLSKTLQHRELPCNGLIKRPRLPPKYSRTPTAG
jgi:hypothetical protein